MSAIIDKTTEELLEVLYDAGEHAVVEHALDILTDPRGTIARGFVSEEELRRELVTICEALAVLYRTRSVFLRTRLIDIVPLKDLGETSQYREPDRDELAVRVEKQFPGTDLPRYVHRRRGLRPLKFLG